MLYIRKSIPLFGSQTLAAGDTQQSLIQQYTYKLPLLINTGTSVYQEKLHADSLPNITWQCPFNINTQRSKFFFINLFKYVEHVKCLRINMDIINVIFIYFPASYKLDVEA